MTTRIARRFWSKIEFPRESNSKLSKSREKSIDPRAVSLAIGDRETNYDATFPHSKLSEERFERKKYEKKSGNEMARTFLAQSQAIKLNAERSESKLRSIVNEARITTT